MAPPEIYISYAWNGRDESGDDSREHIVDKFCETCEQRGFTVKRDKTAVGYRDSIDVFMHRIGAGKYVVPFVSAKYLFSEACMFEAVRMLAHERFEERVFPIVLSDADIFKPEKSLDYKVFWNDKLKHFSQKLDATGRDSGSAEWQLKERDYKHIHEHVGEFITRIAKLNVLSPGIHLEKGFADIFAALEKQMAADNASSVGVTLSHPVTNSEPVFPKLNVRDYSFDHALRPAMTKSIVSKFPGALNLVAGKGQGCFRLIEDLKNTGLPQPVCIIRINLSVYLPSYDAFLEEISRQGNVNKGGDLVGLLHSIAIQRQRPVLFILESLDDMYAGRQNIDARFDIGFLQKMNALKNAAFVTPLVCSHQPISGLSFHGQSSPFAPETILLNSLSYDEIKREITRRNCWNGYFTIPKVIPACSKRSAARS